MSFIRNLPNACKFTYAFGIICLLCAGLAGYTFFTLRGITTMASGVRSINVPSINDLATMRFNAMSVRRSELALILCTTPDCTAHYKETRSKSIDAFRSAAKDYEPLIATSEDRDVYQDFTSKFSRYTEATDGAMAALAAGHPEQATQVVTDPIQIKAHADAIAVASKSLDLNFKQTYDRTDAVSSASTRTTWISLLTTLFIIILCVVIGAQLNNLVTPRIRSVMAMAERLAAKDLTAQVEVNATDELGRMGEALNNSVANLREVLQSVARSADTLSAATTEITASAGESSTNAQNQSAMTGHIATAAQEMTATIGEISRNSESASTSSRVSAETAAQGGQVMQAAAVTMEKIAAATNSVSERITSLSLRSQEIGNVVNVIQEISEQTNLLALNAAIEAARAGEHGRGFAVVAGEVRRLAERTKAATEEIGATIRSIQEETRQTLEVMQGSRSAVETGIEETANARKSLDAIIGSSKEVEHQIELIASAATEQTAASSEIAESAGRISQLATQNTQGAEEAVKALSELSHLASDLDGIIRQFKLEDGNQSHRKSSNSQHHSSSPAPALRPAHSL
jgi:methyl-accepting chemotaxis protein